MSITLSMRSSATAPIAAKTALAQEIWLGVTLVPARNLDSATITVLERDLIGRRFSSMKLNYVDGMWLAGTAWKLGVIQRCESLMAH
ncbi:hypothetical protein F4827_002580 [Paraburkholderia bannensis]|uniref:Uncharacterized protein n=1 Tax=Paraburkholderia bannensis TaxID=765414 RepID=A0A7W9TWM1_9BURK|nr:MULTISPECIES: hypothetical protein [Paraburkholderia]MBB3257715.1 hypothetical protein [Paraburkholderia sp. WP4_3_2]MBB6102728.1 hypothetical protein [Paraburkholderia bannensis]